MTSLVSIRGTNKIGIIIILHVTTIVMKNLTVKKKMKSTATTASHQVQLLTPTNIIACLCVRMYIRESWKYDIK